jgi:hypothetical protein
LSELIYPNAIILKVWKSSDFQTFIYIYMNIFQSILFWKTSVVQSDFVFNKLVYGYGKWDVISHHAHLKSIGFSIVLIDFEGVAEATAD